MLTKQDIQALKDAFKDTFTTKEDLRVLKEDILEAMDEQEKRILESVADVIQNGINPVLDDHEERLIKLEHRKIAS